MLALPFPALDPVAFEIPGIAFEFPETIKDWVVSAHLDIGPFPIRWYALAYLAGFILGWRTCVALVRRRGGRPDGADIDDFLTWAVLGVIFGGRFGYVVFYNAGYYLQHPLEALMIWHGGMSFHGGLIGIIVSILLFSRQRGISPLALGDMIACVVPIGLFFGRIANFINGELYGRVSDVAWAVTFPRGGPFPRHPSQLYEAVLEGAVLFVIMMVLARRPTLLHRTGSLSGIFLFCYGIARMIGECFREPDAHLGFLIQPMAESWGLGGGVTMGQVLSAPMVAIGLAVWALAARTDTDNQPAAAGTDRDRKTGPGAIRTPAAR